MKLIKWVNGRLYACLTLLFVLSTQFSFSQCTTAPIAAAACSGGNGAASGGLTVGSGQTYWVTGSSNNFSTLRINGGILRVCGNLNITTLDFSQGTLIVEAGAIVNITSFSSPNLNGNVVFINRGNISISASFTFQNSGNAIYNDISTSIFSVAGTVTVNNALIVNRGIMSLAGLYYQGAAGNICVQDQSITNVGAFTNLTTNSVTFSGTGAAACLNITGSANLNSNVTGTNKIHVCKKSGVTVSGGATGNPGGGWGSAVVTGNCSSCATVLALNVTGFTATRQDNIVSLQWTAGHDLSGDEVFYVEKSVDGVNFYTLTTLASGMGRYVYTVTDGSLTGTKSYYRVRAVNQAGASFYSPIAQVETGYGGRFQAYPNPVQPDGQLSLMIPSSMAGSARISLMDMTGKTIRTRPIVLQQGNNIQGLELHGIAPGVYIVRVTGNPGMDLYWNGRVFVQERD